MNLREYADRDMLAIDVANMLAGELETALHDGFAVLCQEKGLEFHISLADTLARQRLMPACWCCLASMSSLLPHNLAATWPCNSTARPTG